MCKMTLRLHPADVLMFRETRYFGTGAGQSDSVFPVPRTIAGALRTYMLEAVGANLTQLRQQVRRRVRQNAIPQNYNSLLAGELKKVCGTSWPIDTQIVGPFLGRAEQRLFPAPLSWVRVDPPTGVAVLKPVGANIPFGCGGLSPLALGTDTAWEPLPEAYVDEHTLGAYLANGNPPGANYLCKYTRDKLIADEPRVGVGIDPETLTAKEGLLYTSTFMRLRAGCYLEVDLLLPDAAAKTALDNHVAAKPWLRLGGDGKVARVEAREQAWEPALAPSPEEGNRCLLYLATPGLFDGGKAVPSSLTNVVAVASGKPLCFSGWDLAANLPMPTRYAAPAGTVYFLDDPVPNPDPHGTCISTQPDDQAAGWGYCLRGVWH